MSRIIVKNLPANISDERFRKHFGDDPQITDIKIAKTKDGRSRRFGFIGFKSEADAQNAVNYYNRTFLNVNRLHVAVANDIGGEAVAQRWSKYKKNVPGAIATDTKTTPIESETSLKRKRESRPEENPKLDEFLQVMQPRNVTRSWANEDRTEQATYPKQAKSISMENKAADSPAETEDEASRTVESSRKRVSLDAPIRAPGKLPERNKQLAPVENGASDTLWLRSRTSRVLDLEEGGATGPIGQQATNDTHLSPEIQGLDGQVGDAAHDTHNNDAPNDAPNDASDATEMILTTGRLFLRNLPFSCSNEDLGSLFSPYGSLAEVHLSLDSTTLVATGIGFVSFSRPADAVDAFHALDGKIFQGRLLHLLPGKRRRGQANEDDGSAPTSIKKQRQKQQKLNATQSFNWNSLYMSSDAIVSSIANRMNVPKSELLDPTSSDSAVKQALAESHVIQETKEYFASRGVDVSKFGGGGGIREISVARSDVLVLVKNFPFGTTKSEIEEMFREYGELGTILMPPSATIAIVEFVEPSDAKRAFSKLAYRRFKDTVLYLEKAPEGLLSGLTEKTAFAEDVTEETITAEDDADDAPSATLFVKNLSFNTTQESLAGVFGGQQGFRSALVRRKPDPKRLGQTLSMGFGFVEFSNPKEAVSAMKALQGLMVDGHALQLKISDRETSSDVKAEKKSSATSKVIIKNLPFQINKRELRTLLAAHGSLKSVRMPKKFDNTTRGFAFAEFTTPHEAQIALKTLSDVHLLGRRLVLEYASTGNAEEELEKMQWKVRKNWNAEQSFSNRLGRRQLELD